MHLISVNNWTARAQAHQMRVGSYADAFVKRRSMGQKHAVHDFMFTYYSFSPQKLKQWVPSIHETLVVSQETLDAYTWLKHSPFKRADTYLHIDKQKLNPTTIELATFVATLCRNILDRPARFGCFGLHEWAMVYKTPLETIRHAGHQLRLSQEKLANFVKTQAICCTHYDAYRFFTPEARPLNIFNPTLDTRLQFEQGGCLHANMDLYKWSAKFWPWIGSEFIAQTFLLALSARELDMRASPYDLMHLGYEPICIENEEGRQQYQIEQQLLAQRALPLRNELLHFCTSLQYL